MFLRFLLLIFFLNLNLSRCEDKRNSIISALEKATWFLEEQYNELNIDGVFGYRLLQAYLNGTLEKWASVSGLESEQVRVRRLDMKVSALIEKAKRALEQNEPDSYRAFHEALSPGFWKIPHQWAQNDLPVSFSPTNGSCLDLGTSDSCLSILLGSGAGGTPCLVPDNCRSIMIKTHCSGYGLSHQLFYFLFAEMKGCSDSLFHNAQYYKSVFCHLMMQINVDIEKQALLGTMGDLFTENILFCGLAVFSDFYKSRWLDIILNWQKKERGCFWMFDSSSPVSEDHHKEARRVKRTEKILEGECASHNTAVAVGAIGGFLHYEF